MVYLHLDRLDVYIRLNPNIDAENIIHQFEGTKIQCSAIDDGSPIASGSSRDSIHDALLKITGDPEPLRYFLSALGGAAGVEISTEGRIAQCDFYHLNEVDSLEKIERALLESRYFLENREKIQERLVHRFDYLQDLLKSNLEQQDRMILTLSSACLTLSIAFMKWAKGVHLVLVDCLLISWVFFGLSICCVGMSYVLNNFSLQIDMKQCGANFLKTLKLESLDFNFQSSSLSKWVTVLNLFGVGLFFAGIFAVIFFMIYNSGNIIA